MAPSKRAVSPKRGRPGKKSRTVDNVPIVTKALTSCEALPEDLRSVFEVALPLILRENKADRHAYENEIIEQAEKSLAEAQAALQTSYDEAMKKQNEIVDDAEHDRRTAALKLAEEGAEKAKANLNEKKEAHEAAKKVVHDAEKVVKAAEKETGKSEKAWESQAEKKKTLSDILTTEFELLQAGSTSTPEGKKAVKRFQQVGKEFHFDDTLLQTMPLACKKEPAARSEIENIMFTKLKEAIEKNIESITQAQAEIETGNADKLAAVAAAKEGLERAQKEESTAKEGYTAAKEANRDAEKELDKADHHLYMIWKERREACDLGDELSAQRTNFEQKILSAFEQLKEKQPVEEEPAGEEVPAGDDGEAEEATADAADAEAAGDAVEAAGDAAEAEAPVEDAS